MFKDQLFVNNRFALMVAVIGLVLLMCAPLSLSAQDETAEAIVWPRQYYAPYADMGRYPVSPLAAVAEETGVRFFSLGFMLSRHQECKGSWMGIVPVNNPVLMLDLEKLWTMGGDVIVSFGGAGGTELAVNCTDVNSLVEQYQLIVDTLGVTRLDFDIEGGTMSNVEANERRAEALALLQANAREAGKPLYISFTLSVYTTGLPERAITFLQSAIDHGVDIDVVNIMTMNFEDEAPVDKMGENTILAAQNLFEQLKALYPDKTDDVLWNMIGVTPMIGVNDRSRQLFTPEDAELVTTFAEEQNLRLIAVWSMDRDRTCDFRQQIVSNKCSGLEQEPFAFSIVFNRLSDLSGAA